MRSALVAALALLLACSKGDPAAKHRLFARDVGKGEAAAFDPQKPATALELDADQVARRLGSFDWAGAVEWTVSGPAASVHVTEQHKVRQSVTGEFSVRADVNPGLGSNAVTGKEIVWVGGMTYARALPAPFRERPTDRGRDARRYREDSFGMLRSVAALIGPALRIEADGGGELLGRPALRYRFSLGSSPARASAPLPAGYQAKDEDTAVRQGFLRDAVPTAAEGELLLDAQTGVPLRARLQASFRAPPTPPHAQPPPAKVPAPKGDAAAKGDAARADAPAAADAAKPPPATPRPDAGEPAQVTVVVSSQLVALGGEVRAVSAPPEALPDERKPAGPSPALEAAGLKKRGEEQKDRAEPGDEGE